MEMVNVKAMPGSIPALISGSFVEKIGKLQVAIWGKPTKNINNIPKTHVNGIRLGA